MPEFARVNRFILGDALTELRKLDSDSVHCCLTSPPYWGLRNYGVEGQLGMEKTPEAYVASLVEVFREVRRVLRPDATLWLNLGDCYSSKLSGSPNTNLTDLADQMDPRGRKRHQNRDTAGLVPRQKRAVPMGYKPKDLLGLPWMVAFALRADGWYLRQDIVWAKPNPMPESVKDRCTKSHEYLFLLSKAERYFFDSNAIREPGKTWTRKASGYKNQEVYGVQDGRRGLGFATRDVTTVGRNKRSVWTVKTKPFRGVHFATFPPELIEPAVRAGCPVEGVVLDPFLGAGTTAYVAKAMNRRFIGIELNPDYLKTAQNRVGI